MSEESTVVETEQGQAPVIDTPETHEIDPVESKAREMGWRPKEEYDGDPETWVDAKEYLGRKPLYDEIHKTRKQVKKLERLQNEITQYVKKVEEVAYKKAMADLKAQRKEAISEADPDKVEEIDREIENLNKSRQNVAVEPPPEFREWLDENAWYNPEKNPDVCGSGTPMRHSRTCWTTFRPRSKKPIRNYSRLQPRSRNRKQPRLKADANRRAQSRASPVRT